MYRLITQIESKYIQGSCQPPFKIFLDFEQSKGVYEITSPSPKKKQIIENFGESHLYRNLKFDTVSILEENLPLIRSNIVLVLGLSERALNQIVSPLWKEHNDVVEIQIIKDRNKNILLVIVFLINEDAQKFYSKYNFSMMPDGSHLMTLFLQDMIYTKASNANHPEQTHLFLSGTTGKDHNESWIQLPLCLSCLQKIQSRLSGILYIECGEHTQARQPNKNCPLCNKIQKKSKCFNCNETKQIWGCLICGQLSCGRYKQGHAQIHSFQNNHILAMQLQTNRIWNYQQDGFVHRIIAGQSNIVNFPQNNFGQNQGESTDGILWDYCYKISEQLQKQRNFYQTKLSQQSTKFNQQKSRLSNQLQQTKQLLITRRKQSNIVKIKKQKHEKRKNQLRKRIDEQKQLNKLSESSIRSLSNPVVQESQMVKSKKKQLEELQGRLTELLLELDF